MSAPFAWLTREEYDELRNACSAYHAAVMREGYWAQATAEAAGVLGGAAERVLVALWPRRSEGYTATSWPSSTVAQDVTLHLGGQMPPPGEVRRCSCGREFASHDGERSCFFCLRAAGKE